MRVLVVAFAVWLGSGTVGAIGGGLLLLGLEALLAGPEAQALASEDGLALCGSLFAVPVAIVLLRREAPRPGSTAREYLGLKWPGLRQGLLWGVLLLAADYGYRFLILGLGMPFSNDDRYLEIGSIPLFLPLTFVALAVLTPIFEELLFRGYLLEGLRRSRLGQVGAILITASLWALMHWDLPLRSLGLFLDGSLLALARLRTGSTYLVVLVHAIGNAVAVLAVAND
ncbi:MAG TPA: CPBP family intramembrane glutamic endopeptidase [Thermoanaerobaculia bacterium]|nr:CPBP family intramembrane glutamic endopeptidase [Thermoanaerobaculia bacterium]